MPGNKIYTLRRQERSLIFVAIFQEMEIREYISGNKKQEIYSRKYIPGNGVTPICQEIGSIRSNSKKGH